MTCLEVNYFSQTAVEPAALHQHFLNKSLLPFCACTNSPCKFFNWSADQMEPNILFCKLFFLWKNSTANKYLLTH